jgi:excisionase family DNA binding protein
MERLWTAQEVAEVLALDASTVRRMVKARLLPALRIGGVWRFKAAVVRELMGENPSVQSPTVGTSSSGETMEFC